MANYFRNLIVSLSKYREENNLRRNDFLDLMLDIKRKDVNFTNEDIASHAIGLFADGFETSSSAMSFVFYELATNPEVLTKLREEIEEVLSKGTLTYDSVQEMTYLDAVISESLRKNSPLFFLNRKCTQEFTLPSPGDGIPEITIPVGTSVVVPVFALHYDPQYFPEPERFTPERFLEENKQNITKFTYLPFGEGPRICLGTHIKKQILF